MDSLLPILQGKYSCVKTCNLDFVKKSLFQIFTYLEYLFVRIKKYNLNEKINYESSLTQVDFILYLFKPRSMCLQYYIVLIMLHCIDNSVLFC